MHTCMHINALLHTCEGFYSVYNPGATETLDTRDEVPNPKSLILNL